VNEPATVYEAVGGRPFFDALVERFYAGVESDTTLRPLYPPDLAGPRERLAGFLAQYWGGGDSHYSEARGHPRLRMRHAPFVVDIAAAEAWLHHMDAALRVAGLPVALEDQMRTYFVNAAAHMVNG